MSPLAFVSGLVAFVIIAPYSSADTSPSSRSTNRCGDGVANGFALTATGPRELHLGQLANLRSISDFPYTVGVKTGFEDGPQRPSTHVTLSSAVRFPGMAFQFDLLPAAPREVTERRVAHYQPDIYNFSIDSALSSDADLALKEGAHLLAQVYEGSSPFDSRDKLAVIFSRILQMQRSLGAALTVTDGAFKGVSGFHVALDFDPSATPSRVVRNSGKTEPTQGKALKRLDLNLDFMDSGWVRIQILTGSTIGALDSGTGFLHVAAPCSHSMGYVIELHPDGRKIINGGGIPDDWVMQGQIQLYVTALDWASNLVRAATGGIEGTELKLLQGSYFADAEGQWVPLSVARP